MTEQTRKEFEEWFWRTWPEPDMAAHKEMEFAFMAWQASRTALVIELPKRADTGVDTGGWPNDSSAHRVNCAIAQCAMAIGAAGLKVKP